MSAYLDHIEKVNPKVNAIVALQDRVQLIGQAKAQDEQISRGEVMGPLHGFPHAVKDLQPVKGMRSTMGSPIFKDFIAISWSSAGAKQALSSMVRQTHPSLGVARIH